jgi:hypothetical protein
MALFRAFDDWLTLQRVCARARGPIARRTFRTVPVRENIFAEESRFTAYALLLLTFNLINAATKSPETKRHQDSPGAVTPINAPIYDPQSLGWSRI